MKIKKRNNIAIKNNNTMHKSPQSVKKSERAMTPDGRAIPRKGKKKINDNKNKVKAVNNTFKQKKIVKRISHNNNNENHSLLLSSWNETTAILACPCPVPFPLGASALTPRVQHLTAVETPVFTIIATYLAGIFVAIAVRQFITNFLSSHYFLPSLVSLYLL